MYRDISSLGRVLFRHGKKHSQQVVWSRKTGLLIEDTGLKELNTLQNMNISFHPKSVMRS